MNFDGFQPQTIPRFGSLVQSDDQTELPLGVAFEVLNSKYRSQSVGPRDGKGIRLKFGAPIGGFGVLRYLAPDNSGQENIQIVACTQDGNVSSASPFSQASVQTLTTNTLIALAGLTRTPGLYAQVCQAYNKMHIAQGNLMTGKAPPLIVDGATLTCDPISDKPVGDPWLSATPYRVGQIVSPIVPNGSTYYCKTAGTTAVLEPAWPATEGAVVVDGGVTWSKQTVFCGSGLRAPAAPINNGVVAGANVPAGSTLFVVCTWGNQFGESTASVVNPNNTIGNVLVYKNTTAGALSLSVILPPIPADIAALPSQYVVTGCNVYGYLVAGTPVPSLYLNPASYKLISSNAPGTTLTLGSAAGVAPPSVNGAFTTPAGQVSSGVRYMIVLYQNRTGYICGFSDPAAILCNVTADKRQMLAQTIPIGPYNCVARICAFTVAGAGSKGPYRFISEDDFVDPGLGNAKVKQTATKIPDNVTTSAYFDFLDSYLDGASEVTDYFDRIEVPPCSDIAFSKSLNRVAYTGCKGYPSAILISDLEDSQAIRVPGSIVQVSQTDGDRTVCLRELGEIQIAYKENSGHSVTPNDGDPSDWAVNELWRGSGPCGPRAIDVANAEGQKMHAYAHRTGGWVYTQGAPTWITKELTGTPEEPGIWDRINWAFSYKIRTIIDQKNKVIYFHVPLDAATQNNVRIAVDIQNGIDDPIVFIIRTGREVPNINGRKWSLDNIPANDACYVPQRTA